MSSRLRGSVPRRRGRPRLHGGVDETCSMPADQPERRNGRRVVPSGTRIGGDPPATLSACGYARSLESSRGPPTDNAATVRRSGCRRHAARFRLRRHEGGGLLVVAAPRPAKSRDMEAYKGLSRRMPFPPSRWRSSSSASRGIPLGGFFSKFILFSSAGQRGVVTSGTSPCDFRVLNSALSLYYYARVIWYMYISIRPRGDEDHGPAVYRSVRLCRPRSRHAHGDPRGVRARVPDRRGSGVLWVLNAPIRPGLCEAF